jgi:hypothetical protein
MWLVHCFGHICITRRCVEVCGADYRSTPDGVDLGSPKYSIVGRETRQWALQESP